MLKDRGLIIRNDNDASAQLKIMSYFRLANYLRPMEQDKITLSVSSRKSSAQRKILSRIILTNTPLR